MVVWKLSDAARWLLRELRPQWTHLEKPQGDLFLFLRWPRHRTLGLP